MSNWKRDFVSGLVVIVPIVVLLVVVRWLFRTLQQLGFPKIQNLPVWLAGWASLVQVSLTLTVFVLLVFSVGYLMRTTAGRIVETWLDEAINRLPVVRVVYNASKLAVETALTGTEDLHSPVKVEVWPGMRMTAFKTGKRTSDGRETVFLPTAPNITTGFVIEVDPDDLTETDETVEEALTRVLSAGFGEQDTGTPTVPPQATDGDVDTTPGESS